MKAMEFAHPEFLALLLLPAVTVIWFLRRPGAVVSAPVEAGALVSQPVTSLMLKAGSLLPAVLLAGVVVLLARPQTRSDVAARNPKVATNIEILLNASRSMLGRSEIGYHCRYCASKKAIEEFVSRRGGNTMGISIFGSRHLDLVPLTADLNCLNHAISQTYPDYITQSIAFEKNFAAGLGGSIEKLAKHAAKDSEQILILVTDGERRALAGDEEALSKSLADHDITLFVAMIADGNASPVLARLAEGTPGGRLFRCRDAMGFFEIMRHIDQMKKIEYQDSVPRPVDDNHWLLHAILALTSLYAVFLATPFRPAPW